MDPFACKPQKADKIFTEWKKVLVKPYDKRTVDPYTRLRVILMSGTLPSSHYYILLYSPPIL